MSLPYNPNVPQAAQTIAATQSPIQQNFNSIDTAFNGVTSGGAGTGTNFIKYAIQNTTANFAAKPVNPVGMIYTLSSSSGNPELAWINNTNAAGAGPYTGVQLTGGGVTAAAWAKFTAAGGAVVTPVSYNIASITQAGADGNVTITFTRSFSSADYAFLITNAGFNDTSFRKINIVSQSASNIVIRCIRNPNSPVQSDPGTCSIVCFGTLV
jgi:hypothetical protein